MQGEKLVEKKLIYFVDEFDYITLFFNQKVIEVIIEESQDSHSPLLPESQSFFLKTVLEASDEREGSGLNLTEEMKENILDLSEHDTKILLGLSTYEEDKYNDNSKRDDIRRNVQIKIERLNIKSRSDQKQARSSSFVSGSQDSTSNSPLDNSLSSFSDHKLNISHNILRPGLPSNTPSEV